MANKENDKLPLSDYGLQGLVKALRTPNNAGLRARAAAELGKRGDYQAVESLVRASLEDPDADVQAAAQDALTQLLGSQAGDAVAAYQAGPPPEDAWIEPRLAGDLLKDNLDTRGREDIWGAAPATAPGDKASWDASDVSALLAVVKSNSSQEVRLCAIQALKNIEDTRVVDVLTSLAKHAEGKAVRQAAQDALEDIVGENLPEVLAGDEDDEFDEEDEEEDDLGDEEEDEEDGLDEDEGDEDEDEGSTEEEDQSDDELSTDYPSQASETDFSADPLIQEESISGLKILAVVLVAAAILLVLYLLLR
jgi:HEAT repeat protein